MTKKRSSGCCLWIFLSLTIVCGLFIGASYILFATPLGKVLLATVTPTPIKTCEDLLANIHGTNSPNKDIQTDKRYILDVYKINGDQITGPDKPSVPENLSPLQNDLQFQSQIWSYFAKIIPASNRIPLKEFRIFSDGTGKTSGYNEISWSYNGTVETESWALEVDLADIDTLKSVNDVLIHEFGHMLTLNTHQINIRTEANKCLSYADKECSNKDSYINQFFDNFWNGDPYDEWKTITSQSDPAAVAKGLDSFFTNHPDQFVRAYSATSPKEDIADSWTTFIMTPSPVGKTLLDQKILFFYAFPELVNLRTQIRSGICKYYNMPD